MPVPDFVLRIRERIGHDLLPMAGVTAVVRDDAGRLLLMRRADTGEWALPSGIVEPFEEPAVTVVREVLEETCVEVVVEGLAAVSQTPEIVHPNGDRAAYLDLTFVCRYAGGTAAVGDGEALEVAWCDADALPPLRESSAARLELAHGFEGRTHYLT